MKTIVFRSIVISWFVLSLPQSVAAQANGLDIREYDLSMRLDLEQSGPYAPLNTLSATARITFVNTNEAPVTRVPAILYRLLNVEAVRNGKAQPLDFSQRLDSLEGWDLYQAKVITIDLDRPLLTGDTTTIEIDYAGPMVGLRESGMLYVQDSLDPAFTIIRAESASYPLIAEATRESFRYRTATGRDVFDQIISITRVIARGSSIIYVIS